MRSPWLACAVLSGLVGLAVPAQEPPASAGEGELTPVKILLTMKKTYSRCRSYRDKGVVKTIAGTEDTRFGGEVPFSTAYVRGGAFRFEFTDRGLGERESRCILWWNGAEVHSWWDANPGERLGESLQQALDAASGISASASLRVPGMLLPGVVGAGPPLVAPERLDDAFEGGARCFRIAGKSRATPYTQTSGSITETVLDEKVTLWIDSATYCLRKVEEVKTLSHYRSTRTTTYAPELDVDIPPEQLAFSPPVAPTP